MLKKSTIVLSSCSNVGNICTSAPSSSNTSSCRARSKSLHQTPRQSRGYAMVSEGHSRHHHENIPWPEVTSANRIPSPYQIFGQRKGAPYSKKRFYELVKLYHPDKHGSGDADDIPYETKVERYRLVVAANDLLSDPVRRGAYDIYGAGWNGQPEVLRNNDYNAAESTASATAAGRGWDQPAGPSQNATWEDWERWYQKDAQGKQTPSYVSNSAFVAFIVMFAALGGIGQATRVGNYSSTFIEQRDALHDEMSKDLMRRRRESGQYSDREERIHSFLKQRDPFGYGVIDPQEEQYRRVIPPAEICSSGDIKDRSMEVYEGLSNTK